MHFHRHLKLTKIIARISLSKNYLFMHLTIVHVHCIKNYIKNKLIDNTNLFEHIVSQIIHMILFVAFSHIHLVHLLCSLSVTGTRVSLFFLWTYSDIVWP